jgi:Flp pilus assembly pilin Flp
MFDRFNAWVGSLFAGLKSESGQTFVEYALVLAVVVVGILLAVTATNLGGAVSGAIQDVIDAF